MIKAIISDCFGVLYIPKSEYIYQSTLVNPTVNHDEIRDLVAQNEYGLIDDETLFEGISRLSGVPLHEIKTNLVSGFVRNDELVNYLQSLRPHYKVAMLSNLGRESIVHYFTTEERAMLFDEVVISGEVGMIKPHPEIFEYTCSKLGIDVSEAIFIDDVEANCAGARTAGLRAIHYESFGVTRDALRQILEVE